MNLPTALITGGCSYSQPGTSNEAWPMILEKLPSIRYVGHTGQGAAGNQLISRKVISTVMEAIDIGHKTEDLLVGVMWSGCDRQSHFSPNIDHNYSKTTNFFDTGKEQFIENRINDASCMDPILYDLQDPNIKRHYHSNMASPVGMRNKQNPSHYILNAHWEDELTTTYFEHFVNPQKAIIETCEHILRTQWFLKDKGIKYFFTEYDSDVFHYIGPNPSYISYTKDSECIQLPETYTREMETQHLTDPEINYLYSEIDKDYFLPIENLQRWVTDVSVYKHPRDDDPHPGSEQHKDFVDKVILPFLLEKYNIGLYNV